MRADGGCRCHDGSVQPQHLGHRPADPVHLIRRQAAYRPSGQPAVVNCPDLVKVRRLMEAPDPVHPNPQGFRSCNQPGRQGYDQSRWMADVE